MQHAVCMHSGHLLRAPRYASRRALRQELLLRSGTAQPQGLLLGPRRTELLPQLLGLCLRSRGAPLEA